MYKSIHLILIYVNKKLLVFFFQFYDNKKNLIIIYKYISITIV